VEVVIGYEFLNSSSNVNAEIHPSVALDQLIHVVIYPDETFIFKLGNMMDFSGHACMKLKNETTPWDAASSWCLKRV
jgi:hypothetical protein